MTTAIAHPSGHMSHTNRWLVAAVIVLAAALTGLGIWAIVHEGATTVPAATPPAVRALDQGQMQALVMNRQDAVNARDVARLAGFYTPTAVFYDQVTGTRVVGAQEIALTIISSAKQNGFAFRAEGGPYVVGDRFLVVPFSLVPKKDMARKTGGAQRVGVLAIKDGKIASETGYGMY